MNKRVIGSISLVNILTSVIGAKATPSRHFDDFKISGQDLREPVFVSSENAEQFGIDYNSLRKMFEQFRPTQENEIFRMVPHSEKGIINFSSFDGYSIATEFKYSPVEPNSVGGGNK